VVKTYDGEVSGRKVYQPSSPYITHEEYRIAIGESSFIRNSEETLYASRREALKAEIQRINCILPDSLIGVKSIDIHVIQGQDDVSLSQRAEQLGFRLVWNAKSGKIAVREF